MIGKIVRYKRIYGDGGAVQRYRVEAVGFKPADNQERSQFFILAVDLTEAPAPGDPYRSQAFTVMGDHGDVVQLRAEEMRIESASERDLAEPYVKPPPTAIPGPPERRR